MGKLFLSMLIGMTAMLWVNDDSRDGWRESVRAAVSALAEGARQ
jgi:hypothetical protein